ncbi:MAG: hypothetical protein WBZ54_17520, partial [Methylocella sp.]
MAGKGLSHIAKAGEEKHGARSKLSWFARKNPGTNVWRYFLPFGGDLAVAPAGAAAGSAAFP